MKWNKNIERVEVIPESNHKPKISIVEGIPPKDNKIGFMSKANEELLMVIKSYPSGTVFRLEFASRKESTRKWQTIKNWQRNGKTKLQEVALRRESIYIRV